MKQLIYMSHPFGYDSAMLAGILSASRRNNRRDGITGALICRQDLYLQLVEGEPPVIDALYARIAADDRHHDVALLAAGEVDERLFPGWDMLDDPARSWLWSPAEVESGAPAAASPQALRGVFERVSREHASSSSSSSSP